MEITESLWWSLRPWLTVLLRNILLNVIKQHEINQFPQKISHPESAYVCTMLELSLTLHWVISQLMLQDARNSNVGIEKAMEFTEYLIFHFLFSFLCLEVSAIPLFPLSFMARWVSGKDHFNAHTHTHIYYFTVTLLLFSLDKLKNEIGLHTHHHHHKLL